MTWVLEIRLRKWTSPFWKYESFLKRGTSKSSIWVGFRLINQPAMGVPPWLWKPPYKIISVVVVMKVPSGKPTQLWKITIFNGWINYNWARSNNYAKWPVGPLHNSHEDLQFKVKTSPSLPSQKRLKRWRVTRGAVADGKVRSPESLANGFPKAISGETSIWYLHTTIIQNKNSMIFIFQSWSH